MDIFGIVESQKFAKALAEEAGIIVEESRDSTREPFSSAPGRIVVGKPCAYGAEDYMSSLHKEIAKQDKGLRFLYEAQKGKEKDPLSAAAISIVHRHKGEMKNRGVYLGRDRLLEHRYEKDLGSTDLSSAPAPLQHLFYQLHNDRGSCVHISAPDGAEKYDWVAGEVQKINDESSLERFLRRLLHDDEQEQNSGSDGEGDQGQSGGAEGESGGDPAGQGGDGEQGDRAGGSGEDASTESGDEAGDGAGDSDPGSGAEGEGGGEQQAPHSPGTADGSGGQEAPGSAEAGQGEQEASPDAGTPGGIGGNIESMGCFVDPPFEVPPVNSLYDPQEHEYFRPSPKTRVEEVHDRDVNKRKQGHISLLVDQQHLSRSMKKYLIAEKQVGYQYGLKRGKICPKSIGKLYSAGSTQPRIFKERNQSRLDQNIAVFILGDCSGSMTTGSPSRYNMSAACQISLSSVLAPLRIPHFMALFTTISSDLKHFIMKDWNENPSREKLISRYSSYQIHTDANGDGESVLWAAQILAQRPEARKLLVVLSDGEPAHNSGAESYLKHVCGVIEASRGIELVGIGIQSEAVKKYYKHHCFVKRLTDLEPVLLEVLKSNVIKRR
jgi:cobaltochelatase CobT